jgi:hypothetical protein
LRGQQGDRLATMTDDLGGLTKKWEAAVAAASSVEALEAIRVEALGK